VVVWICKLVVEEEEEVVVVVVLAVLLSYISLLRSFSLGSLLLPPS